MFRKHIAISLFAVLQLITIDAVSQCTAPPAPSAANTTICSGQATVLSATGTGIMGWYNAASGGNWLGSGSSFTTPVLTGTTTYYVQDSTCTASATRQAVTVTVNALPIAGLTVSSLFCTGVAASFNPTSICGNNPAVRFSGSSSASRALLSLATDNITMEIWAKWSGSSAGDNQILFYNGHTGNGGYGILMNPSGNLQILVGGLSYLSSSANLTAGIWQHVAIVRNNGTWSLYLDGTQYTVSSNTTTPRAPNVAGGNQVSIGYAQDGGQRYYGELDEAKFWTVARSTAQIQSDMTACSTTATANLLAYWGFNEASGSSIADGSGNNYPLALNNTSWITAGAPVGISTYAWDYGDGSSSSARGNTHSYATNGSKTVSLTVTDQNNCSASTSTSIVVNQSPTASISGIATNCNLVTLTANGEGSYNWSGGNSTGTAVNTFGSSGNYTVTVTSTAGCTATASQNVVVNALPAAPVNGPLATVATYVSGISSAKGIAFDTSGNLFVSDYSGFRVRKVSPVGTVSTLQTGIAIPQGICTDNAGNVYVTSSSDVKKLNPSGTIVATYSSFSSPYGLLTDVSGKIYVAERSAGRIKIINGGVVSTFVTGLSSPAGIAIDTAGNLYVTEQISSGTVKKISPAGSISTFATGLNNPLGISIDGLGNVYVAETSTNRAVIKITPDGTKSNYVTLSNNPQYLTMDKTGNVYVTSGSSVSKITPPVSNITTVIDAGAVTLIATPETGVTIDWYDQSLNGTLILSNNSNYTTPVVRNTTTYYAEARNATTGCISATRTAVAVTVVFNKVGKNGKLSTNDSNKVSKNGAAGGTGVTRNGKIIH